MKLHYKPLTNAEVNALAIDALAGSVYGTWNQRVLDNIEVVFMVLLFADKGLAQEMKRADIVHIYEHISQAGPRSVNGLPCFTSCKFLSRGDAKRLRLEMERVRPTKKEGKT